MLRTSEMIQMHTHSGLEVILLFSYMFQGSLGISLPGLIATKLFPQNEISRATAVGYIGKYEIEYFSIKICIKNFN